MVSDDFPPERQYKCCCERLSNLLDGAPVANNEFIEEPLPLATGGISTGTVCQLPLRVLPPLPEMNWICGRMG
jgi:hypothetical protein